MFDELGVRLAVKRGDCGVQLKFRPFPEAKSWTRWAGSNCHPIPARGSRAHGNHSQSEQILAVLRHNLGTTHHLGPLFLRMVLSICKQFNIIEQHQTTWMFCKCTIQMHEIGTSQEHHQLSSAAHSLLLLDHFWEGHLPERCIVSHQDSVFFQNKWPKTLVVDRHFPYFPIEMVYVYTPLSGQDLSELPMYEYHELRRYVVP